MGSPRGFQSRFAVLADGDTTITCWVAGTFRWTGASCEAQASVLAHPPSWLHNPRSLLRWLRCGDVVPSFARATVLLGSRAFVRAVPRPSRRGSTHRAWARVVSHVGSSRSGSLEPFGPRVWIRDALGWLDLHLACARSRGWSMLCADLLNRAEHTAAAAPCSPAMSAPPGHGSPTEGH